MEQLSFENMLDNSKENTNTALTNERTNEAESGTLFV
jgi:hypothetical protein